MIELFSYAFIQRAFIVGLLVSLCSALLGVSLVLRRYSMIGDGLSHVGFGALAVASVFSFSPMLFTIPVVVVAAVLLLRLDGRRGLSGDSAIALIASSALAIGIVLISYVKGTNSDIDNFLFGSLLSVGRGDCILSVTLSAAVLLCYVLLYPRLYAVTFDPVFAQAAGVRSERYTTLLAVLSALTIVLGMRMLGSLLISALVIFPCLGAMRVAHSYRALTIVSALESLVCFVLGFVMSYELGTPAGASIVVVHLVSYILLSIVASLRSRGLLAGRQKR